MRIWLDADACPNEVREVVYKASQRLQIEVVLVADRWLNLPRHPFLSLVVVPRGADSADDHIADTAAPGDLVVTDDIPLADRLVKKGVAVVGRRGEIYDESNIGQRLATRDLMDSLRSSGMQTGGPSPYSANHKKNFASAFDRVLTRLYTQSQGLRSR